MYKRCLSALLLAVLPCWGLYHLGVHTRYLVLGLYSVLSLISFIQYALDKRAAIHNRPRIAENTLHITALLGGWPGAWLGRIVLHHKTVKQPFIAWFYLIVLLHQLAWALCLVVSDALPLAAWLT